jgi:DNA mismatch endonuclease (patch repair protein)
VTKAPNFKHFRPSSEKASKALAKIKASNTQGELILRSTLWRLGFRFRKNVKRLPGKPDIVFPRERVAIFCDGDFWHGRNWAKDKRRLEEGPNSPYWLAKIRANIERDKRYNKELKRMGWYVVRLWDSDIKSNPQHAASKVASIVSSERERQ